VIGSLSDAEVGEGCRSEELPSLEDTRHNFVSHIAGAAKSYIMYLTVPNKPRLVKLSLRGLTDVLASSSYPVRWEFDKLRLIGDWLKDHGEAQTARTPDRL
jgi:hypothetical protein